MVRCRFRGRSNTRAKDNVVQRPSEAFIRGGKAQNSTLGRCTLSASAASFPGETHCNLAGKKVQQDTQRSPTNCPFLRTWKLSRMVAGSRQRHCRQQDVAGRQRHQHERVLELAILCQGEVVLLVFIYVHVWSWLRTRAGEARRGLQQGYICHTHFRPPLLCQSAVLRAMQNRGEERRRR